MAYEQEIPEHIAQFESNGEVALKQKWKPAAAPKTASENANGCFDCNICLDSAVDPVVTLCGHLYCWPCIYKWLHVQSSSDESDEEPKCPVCKANISETSLVPLYGRGSSPSESDPRRPQLDLIVPHRPPAHGSHTLLTRGTSLASHPNHQQFHSHPFHQAHPQPSHHQQYFPHAYGNHDSTPPSNFGSTGMASSIFSPTAGMFGEMIFARIFGSLDASLFPYHYSNAYPLTGNGSPRMRRQEMQVEKSLSRVSIFLFCCFVLCLLLF